jgi:signal transduction histidine kinase
VAAISVNPGIWITSDINHFYFEMIAVILSAIVAFYSITRAYTLKEKFSLFVGIGFVTITISVVAFSFFTIFPEIVTDYSIHRPYEIPSLVLFSIALLYFYTKKIYKTNDFFYKGILGALIIDIFGEIIMSFSASNFHTAHNIAHILKNSGYFIIIISLALSSIQYNKIAKEREQVIRVQYERLKESDKMKDEFINVAAHELRTPIQPILSLTEVLRSKIKEPQQQELVDVTIRNAKRLQRLTEDILDVTKIESGSLNLKKEFFNLNDVITNSIDDIIANIAKKSQQQGDFIKLLYQPSDIFIEADKARTTQVISNILNNAIKFTEAKVNEGGEGEERGIININAEKHDSRAIVSIKDTGTGIDPEIFHQLFTKFATKSDKGTGLGLFICKSIVEAHGGKIWAENNNDGKGATFSFSLPLKDGTKNNEIMRYIIYLVLNYFLWCSLY